LCKLSFLRDFFSLFFANLRQKTGLKKYFLFFADFALTSAFLWPYTDFIKRSGFFWGSTEPSLRAGSPAHPGRCMPSRQGKRDVDPLCINEPFSILNGQAVCHGRRDGAQAVKYELCGAALAQTFKK
jgi:hypothetical protein